MLTLRRIPYYGALALLVYMPFHIFLVQSLSLVTGGLSAWKAAKDVLTTIILAVTVLLVWQQHKTTRTFNWFFGLAFAYGLIHLLVWAINPHIYRDGALLGTIYNNRLLWYLLIGMGAALLWPKQLNERRIIRLVLMVSTMVCGLGILQYFLPKDILTHVGYSIARGVKPAFFIDDKRNLPRIMSTLRDPNSLGAYLIVPITILAYTWLRGSKRRLLIAGLLGLHGLALFLTFSRSAWLGTVVSLGVLGAYQFRTGLKKWMEKYWPLALGIVLLVGSLTLLVRQQYVVQNVLVHSDKSTKLADSNALHLQHVKEGLRGILHKSQGHGPGTAGLVSIQNPAGGFLTENYYVQIGYEVGVLGLLVFLAAHALAYKRLLTRRTQLAAVLLASFWGYVLVNMLLHSWSNEAVAAQYWLMLGITLGLVVPDKKRA
ncbi:MAG TPA: O-antigen ligase family protein [Candidatus Saccharimonadales bacterium]|nr:O-antigen ligase family protein [Candidatus Saccharimonadales bacterium]